MTTHLRGRLAAAGIGVLAAVLLAACGGHDDGGHRSGSDHAGTSPSISAGAAFNAADVAFATHMIPHHQQAVEMAALAPSRAQNPEVRSLADAIAKAQGPEIETMSEWLRQWGQPVPSTSGDPGHGGHAAMPGMMSDTEMKDLKAANGVAFDRMFLQMMIRHHEGAIQMADEAKRDGQHPDVRKLAETIAADQAAEITKMRALLGGL